MSTKKDHWKYNPMNLFLTFNGVLFQSLCQVNQSLVLWNYHNVTLNSWTSKRGPSQKQPSKKPHIVDMKICETLQGRISDGVLFLQIYCSSATSGKCLCSQSGHVTKIKTPLKVHLRIKEQHNRPADHLFSMPARTNNCIFSFLSEVLQDILLWS